ncbi:dipeptide epimerase [Fodinibius halophilus]|uniref:Dipeptide epimerase n=1 Tax=Fodinibius halophilus TaxID=1736908 RepID=A0A6M1TCA8_9BACT|nr:dipeptide epimerase [Fodinibius halophilus]NGP89631.1 dipeptide epimerase [Fodinibius halophilus]
MSHFNIECQVSELTLTNPFTIARGTKETVRNVVVSLTADGITGWGEAGPNRRYAEDAETVINFIDDLGEGFFDDLDSPDAVAQKLASLDSPVYAALAALEMAWLDWWAKSEEQPLWKCWNAPSNITPSTSFTIGLDSIEVMQQKVREAEEYPILKVKLGTERDRDIIRGIREITDKPIRVDANEGWKNVNEAKKQITFLADQNIELVEQPMPSAMFDEMIALKQWSPLPLMADESFKGNENLKQMSRAFHGINIKLMKIGSLVKARNVIAQAQKYDLSVMVGCMIESSLAISAGALIGTWADYVDLDGFLLIKDDPFEGVALTEDKKLVLSDQPGLGVFRNNNKMV